MFVCLFAVSKISTFNFKSAETATEMYQDLRNVCGDDCLRLAQVFRRFARFQEDGETLENDPRPGRQVPLGLTKMWKVKKVRHFDAGQANNQYVTQLISMLLN